MRTIVPSAFAVAVALGLSSLAGTAFAQYKVVGADGRVTYTDTPPAGQSARPATAGATSSGGGTGNLPYEVRQASSRYPVTLYASPNCAPCDQARSWLKGHGVPFTEYSIATDDDIRTFGQRFTDRTLPLVTFGPQQVHGFSVGDLQSYADAAGYPKQSRLTGYAWPAAVPLAPPAVQAAPVVAPAPTVPPPPPAEVPSNRPNIRF